MKKKLLLVASLILAAVVAVGCQSDSKTDKTGTELNKAAETANEMSGEAVETIADGAAGLRDEYVEKIDKQLGSIAAKVTDWKDKVNGLPSATRPLATKSLNTLESAQSIATDALGKLKAADVSQWKDHVPAVDKAMESLSGAFKKVQSFF